MTWLAYVARRSSGAHEYAVMPWPSDSSVTVTQTFVISISQRNLTAFRSVTWWLGPCKAVYLAARAFPRKLPRFLPFLQHLVRRGVLGLPPDLTLRCFGILLRISSLSFKDSSRLPRRASLAIELRYSTGYFSINHFCEFLFCQHKQLLRFPTRPTWILQLRRVVVTLCICSCRPLNAPAGVV